MSDEVSVDYTGIADLAGRLAAAAAGLGEWGGALPAVPGTGAGARQTATITAHLLEQVAHLTLALESAAEALDATRESYAEADERSRTRGAGLMAAM